MKRYFIELSYNGGEFNGWQRQQNALSVQQTLEESLSKIIGSPIDIVGCGRTDTGVHASFYIAHFDTENEVTTDADFIYHLNCVLPWSIAVSAIYESDKHARFDAKEREYRYFLQLSKDPFNRQTTWQLTTPLDFSAMQTAAVYLLQHTDFSSFAKLHSDNKTNICFISFSDWRVDGQQATFTIRADRFLRGMVRGIVGTLIDVGRGKITPYQFNCIIQGKDRSLASSQAPAQGLFLTNVKY